jgi:O-methyltransferase
MRTVLTASEDATRRGRLVNSLQGLPAPFCTKYPADASDRRREVSPYLGVPYEEVQEKFWRCRLLDDWPQLLVLWFEDALPSTPISSVAVLRIGGDMHRSILRSLYHRVSLSGYVYRCYVAAPCWRVAIHDFRESHGVTEEVEHIDWAGVFWRKEAVDSARS